MTVSAKVRKSLPASRMGRPGSGGYPMPDKKHAGLAKAFAAMHHAKDKAAIDAKADRILAKKRGGFIDGRSQKPHLGRAGRASGGKAYGPQEDPDYRDYLPKPEGGYGRDLSPFEKFSVGKWDRESIDPRNWGGDSTDPNAPSKKRGGAISGRKK
jgi:hypothetical protein